RPRPRQGPSARSPAAPPAASRGPRSTRLRPRPPGSAPRPPSARGRRPRSGAHPRGAGGPCSRPCGPGRSFRVAWILQAAGRRPAPSLLFPEPPVATDQAVRRAVVAERGLRLALDLRDDPLRQQLAELDSPLVEGVDVPDDALREHAVLVE